MLRRRGDAARVPQRNGNYQRAQPNHSSVHPAPSFLAIVTQDELPVPMPSNERLKTDRI
jgi:hypothetical protein